MAVTGPTHVRSAVAAEAGFTLVEVVIAMLMLTAGALGVMHLAVSSMVMARDTVAASEIGVAAENVLESARDRGFAGNAPGVVIDSIDVGGLRYARRLTVAQQGIRTREIRVDVTRAGEQVPSYSTLTYVVR